MLWLGGITFILLVAIPSTRQVLQGEAGKVMGEVTRRFTPLANFSYAPSQLHEPQKPK